MKKIFRATFISALLTIFSVQAGDTRDLRKITAGEFMGIVRRAPAGDSWAKLEGTASHKRSGSRRIEAPIRLAVRFTPARVIAQLVFNQKEMYNLSQTFADPPIFSEENLLPDNAKAALPLYGIAPSDLTLSFLYRDVVREDKPESVKMQDCRVFVLKDGKPNCFLRVWISTTYAFPVKAEWYDGMPDGRRKPVRELEVGSVKKENGFWIVTDLKLFGPDWRTRVEFEKRAAGRSGESVPNDLFEQP